MVSLVLFFLGSNVFAADVFYPDKSDGSIRVTSLSTWDDAHSRSVGFQIADGPASTVASISSHKYLDGTFQISRAILPFDTSEIPDDAVITDAAIYVFPDSRFLSENDQYSYLQPVGPATPASSTRLIVDDFDQVGSVNNPTVWSDTKNYYSDGWLNNAGPLGTVYVKFPLNNNGIKGIKKDGFTNIGFRLGHDIENVAPDMQHANGNKWGFYSTDFYDINRWPKLEINYYVPTNMEPILEQIGAQNIGESQTLEFTLNATDSNNDTLTYTATNLPTGATLNPATGEFVWTPDYDDARTYEGIVFTVTDDGDPVLTDSESITITVENTNRAPILDPIGNQVVAEGALLQFNISATDPDNDTLTYAVANLPTGATFNPTTRIFSWTPGYNDAGNYTDVEFSVTDDGSPMELDVELITITVGDINRAPEFTNPGPQEVLENTPLAFNVSATDPDNDTVSIIATNMPAGATFDGTVFAWTPTLSQEGIYTISFTATDNGTPNESSLLEVVVTVGDNPTPTEQAENLVDIVVTIDIPQNVENSYLANLQKVAQFILDGKIQAALNQLQAFINKVNQDYQQNILTIEEYNILINLAENLIEDLTS